MTVSLFTKGSLRLTKPLTLYRLPFWDTCKQAEPKVDTFCIPHTPPPPPPPPPGQLVLMQIREQ